MTMDAIRKVLQKNRLDSYSIFPKERKIVFNFANNHTLTVEIDGHPGVHYEWPNRKKDSLKIIRLNLNIGLNDMKIKAKKTDEFLDEGLRVQIDLVLKGRAKYQKTFSDLAKKKIEDFLKIIAAPIKIISELKKQPRGWNVTIAKQ